METMQDSKKDIQYFVDNISQASFDGDVDTVDAFTKSLIEYFVTEISKARKEILERVALETRANVCDCGDEWKDSDLSVWVESELSKLTTK